MSLPEARTAAMLARLVEMTAPPKRQDRCRRVNLGNGSSPSTRSSATWRQAYLFADNAPDLFRLLDAVAFDRVGELLKAVTGVPWRRSAVTHLVRLHARASGPGKCPARACPCSQLLAPHAPARLIPAGRRVGVKPPAEPRRTVGA